MLAIITPTPLGTLLAIMFIAGMSSLLIWMFKLPPVVSYEVVRVTTKVRAIQRIMVPVVNTDYSQRAIELATRIGAEQKSEILLCYVIEVPLTLPLGVDLPEQEGAAEAILKASQDLVAFHNLPYRTRIIRARTAGQAILQAVNEEEVQMIVMGIRPGRDAGVLSRTPEWLLKRADCEIVIDKLPF